MPAELAMHGDEGVPARGETEADQWSARHLGICMSRSIGIMFWLT